MENGVFNVGGYAIHNWDGRAHGDVTWTYVLEDSLNVGAAMAEQRMGNQPFWTFLDRFGIGHPTGVDVQGEVNPGLPPVDQLRDVQLATMSFGQGVSVTPIQMLAAINAVANGGVWIQPHVLDHYVDSAGSVTDFVPAQHQALLPQTAATMRDMMIQVVEHGSGGLAKIPGFSGQIAGKTGTAQVPGPGGYTDQVIGSFVGFLPAQNPRFTMLVIMREPKILFEGAYVAAPIWKEIAQQMIVQWRIAPQ
jgi:cell division protein FtsI/penicillin-binding protein 2